MVNPVVRASCYSVSLCPSALHLPLACVVPAPQWPSSPSAFIRGRLSLNLCGSGRRAQTAQSLSRKMAARERVFTPAGDRTYNFIHQLMGQICAHEPVPSSIYGERVPPDAGAQALSARSLRPHGARGQASGLRLPAPGFRPDPQPETRNSKPETQSPPPTFIPPSGALMSP